VSCTREESLPRGITSACRAKPEALCPFYRHRRLTRGFGESADFARFEAALLIASEHLGRYQASLTKFARANHVALNAIPSAFLSVSLSAAGADSSYPGLRDCVERLERDMFWRPGVVHHAAGAIMVRQSPERAYDIAFFDEFARAAGWTERLSLENPELRQPS